MQHPHLAWVFLIYRSVFGTDLVYADSQFLLTDVPGNLDLEVVEAPLKMPSQGIVGWAGEAFVSIDLAINQVVKDY